MIIPDLVGHGELLRHCLASLPLSDILIISTNVLQLIKHCSEIRFTYPNSCTYSKCTAFNHLIETSPSTFMALISITRLNSSGFWSTLGMLTITDFLLTTQNLMVLTPQHEGVASLVHLHHSLSSNDTSFLLTI